MSVESRKFGPLPVHWNILVWLHDVQYPSSSQYSLNEQYPLKSRTETFSPTEFSCYIGLPIPAGTHIRCDIELPERTSPDELIRLHCCARVLSCEEGVVNGEYGLTCLIENYSVEHLREHLPGQNKS